MPLFRWEIIRRRKPLITRKLHDVSQVLYLPFDLDDGSYARDRSGYSNHGTIYGATRVAGKIGGALDFDGVDDYVDCGADASLDITDEITIAIWAKGDMDRPAWQEFVMKGNAIDRCYALRPEPNTGRVQLLFGGATVVTSVTALSDDTWYHLVGVGKSGSYGKLYINGALDAEATTTYTIPSFPTLSLAIARLGEFSAEYFDGVIDEVRIYNRALSQDEIKRLMNLRGV